MRPASAGTASAPPRPRTVGGEVLPGATTAARDDGTRRRLQAALNRSDYFQGFSAGSREKLARLSLIRRVAKKAILFLEGEKGHAFFCLIDGCVQLSKSAPEGQEVVIRTLKPGEVFGEVILFEENRYPVTASALRDSTCAVIPVHPFHCLLQDETFQREFIAFLMRRQRYLADRIRYLTAHDLEERLTIFLREHYGQQPEILPGLSKKDLAAAIGATPESLSRLLLRLRRDGRMTWEGSRIRPTPRFWL